MNALERATTLTMIDDSWKTHLRTMDELKQSVQMAGLEQKDPLLVYKLEAFNLFKEMVGNTNRSLVSFLFRAGIPFAEQQQIQEAEEECAPATTSLVMMLTSNNKCTAIKMPPSKNLLSV
jgi:preprotein translocase subunit SecA